ncbi:MAG: Pyruvate formate-lyase 1-activating enzyme [Firmicutes bacterium ADurb.Bin193]|nr:MAG: Pyruvate formate-lyase 1-activating enzyme [Firmicutes bacterium ADurb.Bin193]
MRGRVHSIETLGALDGPGIRTVVFMQGCPLRCAYCHNPDTWNAKGGVLYTPNELFERVKRFKPYFKSEGGLTLSGGEPLLQGDFCAEVLRLCRNEGIKTAIDTSGYILHKEAVDLADLIILDIKHTSPERYKALTGADIEKSFEFLDYCKKTHKPLWIRQVILTGINDTKEDMEALKSLIKGANVKKTELLPYHKMGVEKWDRLGLNYPLKDTESPTEQKMEELSRLLL